ncbi:Putative hemagglutinin-related protein [Geitlerinema sp. FC II]|nr:Putative hemagglutinin-related protein [Geitlerinema sp. FC II]
MNNVRDDRTTDGRTRAIAFPLALLETLSVLSWMAVPAFGQIVPDTTLPVPSTVNVEGNTYTLDGGTEAGNNLFHSFREFSVPTGTEAMFDNAANVENILTRITGNDISNIDGLLRANGTANLFLLNPNGIVFGPNARLDIGGSFLASTADSIQLSNGRLFSASDPNTTPLLSVSVPVGLQFGNREAGRITVHGIGHTLNQMGPFAPYILNNRDGLEVRGGNTLALVGGDVTLTGGQTIAPGGRMELGSVNSGLVTLNPTEGGWTLDYDNVSSFRDVRLSQRALVDASGLSSGSIQVSGRQITIASGASVFLNSQGDRDSGNIDIRAREVLELNGFDPSDDFRSSIAMQTTGTGEGGNVNVNAPRLRLIDGGFIANLQINAVGGGALTIEATESVTLDGRESGDRSIVATAFGTTTLASGPAGDVTVNTPRLSMINGGIAVASTASSGTGGNFTVNADVIEVLGSSPQGNRTSRISASSLGSGEAGRITLNTRILNLRDSGDVQTFGTGTGNAGEVVINASERIEVNGRFPTAPNSSAISSSVTPLNAFLRNLFNLPEVPTGNSGNVTVNTPELRISNEASVNVRNAGIGDAGNLQINVETLELDRNGQLSATTARGEGGNIMARIDGLLNLRRGSSIVTNANTIGNGGNIAIRADTIALLENSAITANAIEGTGGNIEIETQGLYLSPDSRITASSQLGVDGIVEVTEPAIDTSEAILTLTSEPIDPATQVVSACETARENTFIVTGNGGLPPDPTQMLQHQTVWVDIRLTEIDTIANTDPTTALTSAPSNPIGYAGRFPGSHQGFPASQPLD